MGDSQDSAPSTVYHREAILRDRTRLPWAVWDLEIADMSVRIINQPHKNTFYVNTEKYCSANQALRVDAKLVNLFLMMVCRKACPGETLEGASANVKVLVAFCVPLVL